MRCTILHVSPDIPLPIILTFESHLTVMMSSDFQSTFAIYVELFYHQSDGEE